MYYYMRSNSLDITEFIIKHNKYLDKEKLEEYVKQHQKYGTIDYAIDDKNNIIAVCRWNMSDNGIVAEILDFCIEEEWRNKGLGKDFIIKAMKRFPNAKYLEFKRGVRGDHRIRKIKVDFILNRDIF